MARPSFLKRKFFIKKQFQGRFILLYSLTVSGIVGLGTFILFFQINAAVERHLYSTHIKIERVGDFLVNLLFGVNFYIILTVVIVVLLLSLLIFKKINSNFSRMEETIQAMAEGDFAKPFTCDRCFMEAGDLTSILEQSRMNNLARFEQLNEALNDLEQGTLKSADQKLLESGKDKLKKLLGTISLS
jgi:methyl-accepting chemotaxis protein